MKSEIRNVLKMFPHKRIILASQSPRRAALLRQIGLEFEIITCDVDETVDGGLSPEEHVLKLSHQKASLVAADIDDGIIIGADTIVVLDGEILGKPTDAVDAKRMLQRMSGREHRVYTGFTLIEKPSQKTISEFEVTDVKFRELENDEIDEYVASGSPLDKAGAYGIQDDYGAVFVERVCGCFYTVVGFPLTKFYMALRKLAAEVSG